MSDSTSGIQLQRYMHLTDIFEKVRDLPQDSYLEDQWFHDADDAPDEWYTLLLDKHFSVADRQYANHNVTLRLLGRTEPNATAAPESRSLTNQYPDDRASILESRIKTFLSYREDWDGDGAKKIPMPAIYASLNFLNEFGRRFSGKEPRSAAPSPNGEIVLYWYGPTGYAEVNFDSEGKMSMCWSEGVNEMNLIEEDRENVVESDCSTIWETLSEVLGQGPQQG